MNSPVLGTLTPERGANHVFSRLESTTLHPLPLSAQKTREEGTCRVAEAVQLVSYGKNRSLFFLSEQSVSVVADKAEFS